jgi:YVTN family beta-propeller protein
MSELALPPQVLAEIGSPIRENRLAIVDQLGQFSAGADLALAAAARDALQHLTEDDSRSVAAAASAALERTAVRLSPDRIDFGQVPPDAPRLTADILVDGPPLAIAAATLTVSGPGLRAMLSGRRLRVVWLPRSDWLDGSVTVRGPAGWADVRVTGQVMAGAPTRATVEARLRASDGVRGLSAARMTVLPAPAPRRRKRTGATVLVAGLAALVVLGGVGVAVAMTTDNGQNETPLAAAPTGAAPSVQALPTLPAVPVVPKAQISRVPVAKRVTSIAKPAVLTTFRVGDEPEGVIVSPDGRTVYVANQNSRILSVVDAATRKVTPVRLRNTPRFVATSRDGRFVYVSMYEDDKRTGSGVAVVDAARRTVTRYLTTGMQPYTLSVAPDGRLWVPIHSEGRVEIYQAGSLAPAGQVKLPPNPHAVAFSPDTMRAFTANHESNSVSVIDMRTNRLVKSITVSKAPHSIAASADGRTVLVAGYEADRADLIDTVTLKRSGPYPVGNEPQAMAFAPDSRHAYVVNEEGNSVSVLNGRTGAVTATVPVGRSPRSIGMSPDGRLAYVSNGDDNTVSVLRVGE